MIIYVLILPNQKNRGVIDRAEMWGLIYFFYLIPIAVLPLFIFFVSSPIFFIKNVFNTKKYQIGVFWSHNINVDVRWFGDQIWSVLDWYGFGGCWLMFACNLMCIWDQIIKIFFNTFLHQFGIFWYLVKNRFWNIGFLTRIFYQVAILFWSKYFIDHTIWS